MNKKLQHILLTPLGWALDLLARMPWWLIFVNADALYFVVYKLIGYRKKVVQQNLIECFPEKSKKERHKIEQEFYHQFADYFFETIKLLHVKDEDLKKRMVFHNAQFIDEGIARGQSVMLYAAHIGNWEWLTSVTMWLSDETRARGNVLGEAYHPLENEWFDKFFIRLRSRYTSCYPGNKILRMMMHKQQEGKHMALGFLSDQHPLPGHDGHIVKFLNHPTAIINGTEAVARILDMRVGYFYMRKVKRGHYECTLMPMCEYAKQTKKGELSRQYAQLLEENIKEQPAYWLWTHKRWKRPVKYPDNV